MKEMKALPSNLKLNLEVKGSLNPSQGIFGSCPNLNNIERQKTKRSKGMIYNNYLGEKGEVIRSDMKGFHNRIITFVTSLPFLVILILMYVSLKVSLVRPLDQ